MNTVIYVFYVFFYLHQILMYFKQNLNFKCILCFNSFDNSVKLMLKYCKVRLMSAASSSLSVFIK